jgi:hypothetical protein
LAYHSAQLVWTSGLLALYADEISLSILPAKALMLYAQEGDSAKAKQAKKEMHQSNKHAIKYLTWQKKAKHTTEYYQPSDASEAEMYVAEYAKEAWRSLPGRCFGCEKYRTAQCLSTVYFVHWPVNLTPTPFYFFI